MDDFDLFFGSYMEAVKFTDASTADDECNGCEFSDEAIDRMRTDCAKFWDAHGEKIVDLDFINDVHPVEKAGHDFWLTRNGHGAGFWDGDWDRWPVLARRLDQASKDVGNCDVYKGDDGKIHLS